MAPITGLPNACSPKPYQWKIPAAIYWASQHENLPNTEPNGSFVGAQPRVDPTKWNRYSIEVKNNSIGDANSDVVPEDGIISVRSNDEPFTSKGGFRFRTVEELSIKSVSLMVSRGESGPEDTKDEIHVLLGGVVIQRLYAL